MEKNENDEFWDWLKERKKADDKRDRLRLKEAKKEAKIKGKEKFSFKKLCQYYDPTSDFARPGSKPTRQKKKYMEFKYYVYCPEIMTIKEYADYLEMMDIYNP